MSIASPSLDPNLLTQSHAYCEQLTRSAARNFYYGLKLLPRSKRLAMFALYAYMRHVDDIADDEDNRSVDQRLSELESWRLQTHAALGGNVNHDSHALWPAFAETVRAYRIPAYIFDDVIAGQEQDLRPIEFATFEQLREYCYRVAGTVGLASIHIWGFEGGKSTEELAIDRGVAFQLTNILRDLSEDSQRGRIYLPRTELAAMNVSPAMLHETSGSESFCQMMQAQVERAESYYALSSDLESRIERDSRASLIAMTRIYHGILKKIAADPPRVLRERISLSVFSKLRIGWHAVRGT